MTETEQMQANLVELTKRVKASEETIIKLELLELRVELLERILEAKAAEIPGLISLPEPDAHTTGRTPATRDFPPLQQAAPILPEPAYLHFNHDEPEAQPPGAPADDNKGMATHERSDLSQTKHDRDVQDHQNRIPGEELSDPPK